ncbi:hypothetical protein BH18ACT5_BH18ACT5_18080 [soil metagenome]
MSTGQGSHGRWLVFLIVGLAAGVAVTYFLLPRRAPAMGVDESICARAFATSDGITAYLADREEADPGVDSHPLVGVPEEDRDAVWAEYLEATAEYTSQTVAGFYASFAGESQFLVERFSAAGAWEAPTQVVAVNELAVRDLALQLDAAALRAGCVR